MYFIETSVGTIYFNYNADIHKAVGGFNSELSISAEDWNRLRTLYHLDGEFAIKRYQDKVFIEFYLDDGYYGCPEYRIHQE